MTFAEISRLSPSAAFYNLKDKLINYTAKRSFEQFDIADNERNSIKTNEEFVSYKANKLKVLKEITGDTGYDKKLPLCAKTVRKTEEENLIIENVIFTSRKNVYVTANLYLPKHRKGKIPAIVMQMGHSDDGRLNSTYQKVARIHAGAGLAVFAIDPAGQGERLNYIENGKNSVKGAVREHQHFGNQCFLTGNFPVKYFLCDAMRAVDYLETREEIDSQKIGATGTSGGGTMTSVLMAYDERIKAASPSCFLTTRRAYMYAGGNQDAEQIWVNGTKYGFDHYELVSLFCPKPLLILSVQSDFFPLEGTDELLNKEKEFYTLMGQKENISMYVSDSQHKYTVEAAAKSAEFFLEVFCGLKKSISKDITFSEETQKLLCTKSGQIGLEFKDSRTIFEENLSDYNNAPVKSLAEKQEFFKEKVFCGREKCKFYLKKFDVTDCEDMEVKRYMWYSQPNMPCYGVEFRLKEFKNEKLPVKICLFENGTDDIVKNRKIIEEICCEGYSVLVADLSGMGKCMPYDLNYAREAKGNLGVIDKLSKDLFFLGDSLCALRAYDLMRTTELLTDELNAPSVSLFATESASVYARIAEIINPLLKVETRFEISIEDIVKDKYYNPENLSGVIMPEIALYLKK